MVRERLEERDGRQGRPSGNAVHSHHVRSLEELQQLVATTAEAKKLALRCPELVETVEAALRCLGSVESSLRTLGLHVACEESRAGSDGAYRRDARLQSLSSSPLDSLRVVQLSSPKALSGSGLDLPTGDSSGSDNEQGISGWKGTVRKGPRGTILPTDLASLSIAPSPSVLSPFAGGEMAAEEEDFDAEDWGLEEGFAEAVVEKDEAQVHFLPQLTAQEERAMSLAADQHRHMRYWERSSPATDSHLIRRMGIVLVAANAKRIAKQQKEARRQAGIVFEEADLVRSPRKRSPVHRLPAKRSTGTAIANEDDFADGVGDDDLELSLANFGKGKSNSSTESGSEDWDAAFDEDFSEGESSSSGTLALPSAQQKEEPLDFDDDFDFPEE